MGAPSPISNGHVNTEQIASTTESGIYDRKNSNGAGGKRGSRFDSKRDSLPQGVQKRRLTSVSLASLALSQNIRGSTIYEDEDDEYMRDEKDGHIDAQEELDSRQSPWFSLWLGNVCQCMCGIQFSIYMMSMWPYLSNLDESADLTFLGWIIAAYSVGQAIASPLFGVWNQRTMSTKYPVALGLIFCIIGNAIYGVLPTFTSGVKWIMLGSRFIIGFGSGNYAVLRSYTASASVPRDRTKAIALATGSYVLGISFGPAIQMIFSPIGDGFVVANMFHFNMFTLPAFVMCIINAISFILLFTVFKEDYAGILSKGDRSGKDGEYFVLPKTDWVAISVCIYMFFIQNCVSTMMETGRRNCVRTKKSTTRGLELNASVAQ
uniref:Membrane transporter n=1 Tax=Pristionchus pacificus TaxID=54126 RepID=A0A2A6CA74_PRIPA|eukprot:PDM74978.1 membrane transporter [Pristionchus pacificus]